MHIALTLELWQVLIGFCFVISTWAVALYKISVFGAFHKQHFSHAADVSIHQTHDQRVMTELLTKTDLKAHADQDELKFKQVTDALAELKMESTKWQATLNNSILDLTRTLIGNK